MDSDIRQIAGMLKVMANEHRLQILCELIEGPKTVSALGEKIAGISQSALSQHLALLKAHKLADCEKHGQSVIYRIADARLEEILAVLKRNYCKLPPQ